MAQEFIVTSRREQCLSVTDSPALDVTEHPACPLFLVGQDYGFVTLKESKNLVVFSPIAEESDDLRNKC
jgi:hypothetical protein